MVVLAFAGARVVPIDVSISWSVLGFSTALAFVTTIGFSAAPALALSRAEPMAALRGAGRGGGERAFVPRRSLVILQVALSLVLIVGAGLLASSLRRIEAQPLGFVAEHRVVAHINVPPIAGDVARLTATYRGLVERIGALPGVTGVTYSLYSPMEGNNWSSGISIQGRPSSPDRPDGASWNRVGPHYFDTLGTPVIQGRAIDERDAPAAAHVVDVNQAFVKKFLPAGTPVGRRLGIGDATHAGDFEIVGVVADVKYTQAGEPVRPMIFLPALQTVDYDTTSGMNVQARSTILPSVEIRTVADVENLEPLVRHAVSEVDPAIAVSRFSSLADQVSLNFSMNRLMASLTSAYGLVALALAAIGLYGVTAYAVARRRREFGVRLALGAEPGRVVRQVVGGALRQTGIGLAIGAPIALAAASMLASLLYGVSARDPAVLALAVVVLTVTTVLAALIPARRAASVDPTEALRTE